MTTFGIFLRNIVLWLLGITFILVWLPLIRGLLDGVTYEWGLPLFGMQFSGAGLEGDYWVLVAQTVFAAIVLFLGFRRPGKLFYLLAGFWLAQSTVFFGLDWLASGTASEFRGDTLDVEVSFGLIATGIYAAGFILLVFAWLMEQPGQGEPKRFDWTGLSSAILLTALALLPLQFVLLRFGTAHETTDEIGVIMTMAQLFLLVLSLAVGRSERDPMPAALPA